MTDVLFALGKVNLAMGMAIILVSLLRRPLRVQFGAPIAYAIWFLVPVAGMASLLPPRVAAPSPHRHRCASAPSGPMSAFSCCLIEALRCAAYPTVVVERVFMNKLPLVLSRIRIAATRTP